MRRDPSLALLLFLAFPGGDGLVFKNLSLSIPQGSLVQLPRSKRCWIAKLFWSCNANRSVKKMPMRHVQTAITLI